MCHVSVRLINSCCRGILLRHRQSCQSTNVKYLPDCNCLFHSLPPNSISLQQCIPQHEKAYPNTTHVRFTVVIFDIKNAKWKLHTAKTQEVLTSFGKWNWYTPETITYSVKMLSTRITVLPFRSMEPVVCSILL
jgi:hypothetical protein